MFILDLEKELEGNISLPCSFSHYLPTHPTPSALIRGHRGADVSIYLSVLTEYLNTRTDRAASPSDQ